MNDIEYNAPVMVKNMKMRLQEYDFTGVEHGHEFSLSTEELMHIDEKTLRKSARINGVNLAIEKLVSGWRIKCTVKNSTTWHEKIDEFSKENDFISSSQLRSMLPKERYDFHIKEMVEFGMIQELPKAINGRGRPSISYEFLTTVKL